MTDHNGTPEAGTTHTPAGMVYAVLAPHPLGCCSSFRPSYAFLIAGPGGDQPGVPPRSMAVLEVRP